jgi:thiol:disulfide interchange protein
MPCVVGCDSSSSRASRLDPPAHADRLPAPSPRLQFAASFREGSDRALREGKPLLLFFAADWCEHCRRMARESFSAQQVAELSERFVCVRIDAEQDPALCQQFGVSEFPTVQFVSARGAALHRVVGRRPPKALATEMHAALQAVAYEMPATPTVIRR